jgi:hypothetical protein
MATKRKATRRKKKPCKVKKSCSVVNRTTGNLKKGYRYKKGGGIVKAKKKPTKRKAKPAKKKTVKRKTTRKPVARKKTYVQGTLFDRKK